MGLTVFAIGGCTPELITGVIMARRGNLMFSRNQKICIYSSSKIG